MDQERKGRLKHMLASRSGDKRDSGPLMQSANKHRKSNWMEGAVKHPGALTRKAQSAGESTSQYAHDHAHDSGTTGKQARLAETFAKFRK